MIVSRKHYAFSMVFMCIFVLNNGFAQHPVISDEELKKSLGINLSYSFIQDHSTKSKFNSFAYRNTFLRKSSGNHYLSHSLSVEYNQNTHKEYPYYLFNRTGFSSVNQALFKVSRRNSLTLVGAGIKGGWFFGVKPADFRITYDAVVSGITDPDGTVFTVPITYPLKYRMKKGFVSAGPHVSLNHFIPFSRFAYVNLNLQYTYSLPSASDYSCGVGLFLKLKDEIDN